MGKKKFRTVRRLDYLQSHNRMLIELKCDEMGNEYKPNTKVLTKEDDEIEAEQDNFDFNSDDLVPLFKDLTSSFQNKRYMSVFVYTILRFFFFTLAQPLNLHVLFLKKI